MHASRQPRVITSSDSAMLAFMGVPSSRSLRTPLQHVIQAKLCNISFWYQRYVHATSTW